MIVSRPYAPIYTLINEHQYLIPTPRASGKSTEISQFARAWAKKYPDHDMVFFRANQNSLVSSVMVEVEEKFVAEPDGDTFIVRQSPYRLEINGGRNVIYFVGISGHDKSRVRGFKPKHPLSAIIGDELQQVSELDNLKHALATFRRYFDTDIEYKMILCGNPHEVKAHWWNVYVEQYSRVYTTIRATYKDIAKLLNKDILDDIALEKKINPALYRFMYEGDLSDISGSAYASFRREKHLISPERSAEIFKGEIIEAIIWGGDGAITHDMTAIVPIAIMSSGRFCVLERFIFDPLRYGRALAPSELAELILRYVDDMDRKYCITRDGIISSYFVIDCAAADLITQLAYTLDQYHIVKSFTTKNIIRNNSAVNNCFARNCGFIIDYGGYFDYSSNRFIECRDPLAEQLESVVWKGTKFDPAIPNDISDALTYGLSVYYENPDNLYLPERRKTYDE